MRRACFFSVLKHDDGVIFRQSSDRRKGETALADGFCSCVYLDVPLEVRING